MSKLNVLVTGASGKIAGQLLPAFRERYNLRLLDIKTTNRNGEEIADIITTDLLEPNRDRYREHFKGMDAVVHIGFVGNANADAQANPDTKFAQEYANIQMAYNVYQTCLEEGVKRVVVASSNHAADYYEQLILDGDWDMVNPNDRALSDNYYGWAKETYEHLGFVFAAGKQARTSYTSGEQMQSGQQLENVQLRIGGPRETDVVNCKLGDLRCMRRALAVYISDRDMQQLFIKSIEAPDIRDERGVPFQIFYGISANHHAFWSIANARQVINYQPEDNSEIRFAQQISEHIKASQEA